MDPTVAAAADPVETPVGPANPVVASPVATANPMDFTFAAADPMDPTAAAAADPMETPVGPPDPVVAPPVATANPMDFTFGAAHPMATRAPFPHNPEDFADDYRIAYSLESKTYLLEDENGVEWEWRPNLSTWAQTVDEALIKQQQEIYKLPGVDEEAPDPDTAQANDKARAKAHRKAKAEAKAEAKAKAKATTAPSASKPTGSTAVYVTGLPLDVDTEEIRNNFKKFGIIAESADDDQKRIKLYRDPDGNFKGEALVIYFRPESALMAADLLDGSVFLREFGRPTSTISVEVADWSYKKFKDDAAAENPTQKAKPSKAQIKRKAKEMNRRITDWSSDGDAPAKRSTVPRYEAVVILKGVFVLDEIKKDPSYLDDVMEDMKEGAEPHGEVKNISIFDEEEDGVVTIRFSNAQSASACVSALNGRYYDGRRLEASIAGRYQKFKKRRKTQAEKDAEEARRLEQYSRDIEADSANESGDA